MPVSFCDKIVALLRPRISFIKLCINILPPSQNGSPKIARNEEQKTANAVGGKEGAIEE